MTAISNFSTRSVTVLLIGCSGLALATPALANDVLFSTAEVRPQTGQRTNQVVGLTQIALTGGGTASVVDAADYTVNADGSIDLYAGSLTVAGTAGREIVVRMPDGLEGRVTAGNSAANFTFGELNILNDTATAPTNPADRFRPTGRASTGIALNGNSGTFTVSGTTSIESVRSSAISITDTTGAISFGQTSITGPITDVPTPVNPVTTNPVTYLALTAGDGAGVKINGTIGGDDTMALQQVSVDVFFMITDTKPLEVAGKTLETLHLLNHSHMSETYAVGTSDDSLTAPVLDFIQRHSH